jgi:uncharacterized protein with PQ loop repeat
MDIPLILGYMGSIGLVTMLIPQILHIVNTKDGSGMTWQFIILQYYVTLCFTFYGLSINALPVILSNMVVCFQNIIITRLKLKYPGSELPK